MNGLPLRRRGTLLWKARAVLLAILLPALSAAVWAGDFVVIANKDAPVNSLSAADAQAIFLGDMTRWTNGKRITFVVLDEGKAHKAFLEDVVGKTPTQFESYWRRLVFAGKAAAPIVISDPDKLLDFVAKTPGAVGFVPAGQAIAAVKSIAIK